MERQKGIERQKGVERQLRVERQKGVERQLREGGQQRVERQKGVERRLGEGGESALVRLVREGLLGNNQPILAMERWGVLIVEQRGRPVPMRMEWPNSCTGKVQGRIVDGELLQKILV